MATFIPGPTPLVTSSTPGLIPAPPEGEPTGKVFTDSLEWEESTGGATPAGTAGSVQIHDGQDPAGLGAVTGLDWDDAADVLNIPGDINLDDGGTYTTTLQTITPTANRTISFPDATGTVALVAGTSGQLTYNLSGAQQGLSASSIDGSGNLTFSARWIQSVNGAASAPSLALTGTWFTGGTATTTKPHFLIEPAGTTSTAWSTSGTGLGVNAPSGFTGNLLDLQVNGTSTASLDKDGFLSVGRLVIKIGSTTFGNWSANVGPTLPGTERFRWIDLELYRDAADILAQRRATNAQTFRLYNTFTSATNFERLNARWTSDEAILDTEAGSGGGTLRGLKIGSAATSLLGFYGATPVDQPAAVADATDAATVITQLNALLARIRELGFIAT